MDEKIQESLASILEFIEQGVETGASFAAEQTPLVIQEILRWGIIEAIFGIVSWAIFFGGLVVFFRIMRNTLIGKEYPETPEWKEDMSDSQFCWIVLTSWVPTICGFVYLLPTTIYLLRIIKILMTPRLYLITEIGRIL